MATSWQRPHSREHLPNNIGHLWTVVHSNGAHDKRRMRHDSPSPFVRRKKIAKYIRKYLLDGGVFLHFGRSELCVCPLVVRTMKNVHGEKRQTKQNKNAHTDDTNNNNSHRRAHNKLNCRFGHQSVIAIPTQLQQHAHSDDHASHGKTHHDRGETPSWVALRFEMAH